MLYDRVGELGGQVSRTHAQVAVDAVATVVIFPRVPAV